MLSKTTLLSLLTVVSADVISDYYQCGGTNYSGSTECDTDASCYSWNPYYYQCVPTQFITSGEATVAASLTSATAAVSSAAEAATTAYPDTTTEASAASSYVEITAAASSYVETTPAASSAYSEAETSIDVAVSSHAADVETVQSSSAEKISTTEATTLATSTTAEAASSAASTAASTYTSSADDLEVVSGGFSGTGTTTRYWDCCKPSCAWSGKSSNVDSPVLSCDASGNVLSSFDTQSGCVGGTAYMCNDQSPWAVSDDLAYGFAAASLVDGTEDNMCCTCMKLTFTSTALEGKVMVVQLTNTGSDLGSNQFDLALPGGGVGIYTAGCSGEFGDGYSWGEQYGGVSAESDCSALPTALYDGCEFRFDWFEGADNPSVTFEQVVCPEAITAISGCSRTDE